MIKKTVKYVDYDGNERQEDFWFHLNKAELAEMELGQAGGLSKTLQRMIDSQDGPELMKMFKDIILKSYGKKSDDGRRFIKKPELIEDFVQTEAYSQIYMELATNTDAIIEFVNGIMPSDMKMDDPKTAIANFKSE